MSEVFFFKVFSENVQNVRHTRQFWCLQNTYFHKERSYGNMKLDPIDTISKEDLIAIITAHGIMEDESELCDAVTDMKRHKLLAMHNEDIWQGKDGRYRTHIRDKTTGKRRLIARNTLKGVEDALCEHYQEMITDPTIEDVFKDWIDGKVEFNELSEPSRIKYMTEFRRFFEKSGFGTRRIKTVTEEDLVRFVKTEITTEKLTEKAFAGLKILLRGIFKHGKAKGYTAVSIATFFDDLEIGKNAFAKKVTDPELEVLHEEEIPLIKAFLKDSGTVWDLGLLLCLQTGVRVGELSALRWEDWDGRTLKIRRTEAKAEKNRKQKITVKEIPKTDAGARNIILTDSAVETLGMIKALNPDAEAGDWIFKGRKSQRIRGNTFNKHLDLCLKTLGLEHRTMHKLRKTYCTELKEGGADDTVVQRQLGHNDISTTLKYYVFGNRAREKQRQQVEDAIKF